MVSINQFNQENDGWLTPKQAALRIGVSASFIYKLVKTNQLPASRVGSKLLRIKASDADAIYRPTSKTTAQSIGGGKADQ
jgi:excisionase family DNA binding protein